MECSGRPCRILSPAALPSLMRAGASIKIRLHSWSIQLEKGPSRYEMAGKVIMARKNVPLLTRPATSPGSPGPSS